MKNIKKARWLIAFLVLATVTITVRATVSNTVYLPLVMVQPTLTPTITLTPTPTKTPTPTPTPNYVVVNEIVNPKTGDPLNEYVKIYNGSSKAVDLTGWFIRDDGSNRYNFPNDFWIGSKGTIRLWTKTDWDTATDLYWDSPVEVWNDEGDCAYLRDNSKGENELVDVYCYKVTQEGLLIIIRNPEE